MPRAIETKEVLLTRMDADQMTPFMAQSGVRWYSLSMIFRNISEQAVYLVTDIRQIRYDEGRRVLMVWLSEPETPGGDSTASVPKPPQYRMVGAGEEVKIVHPLSSPITFLETTADGVLKPRLVRLAEDVDAIECTVAYETESPAPASDLTAWKPPAQPRSRENKVTATWKASPSKREPKKTSE